MIDLNTKDGRTEFGKRIAARRKAVGFKSQEAFSETLGVDRSTVSAWESGRNIPDLPTIQNLCKLLSCDLGHLLGDYDEPEKDIHFVCEYTGLSEKGLQGLRDLRYKKGVLDAFLNSPHTGPFLSALGDCLETYQQEPHLQRLLDLERKSLPEPYTHEQLVALCSLIYGLKPYNELESLTADELRSLLNSYHVGLQKEKDANIALFVVQKEAVKIAEEFVKQSYQKSKKG